MVASSVLSLSCSSSSSYSASSFSCSFISFSKPQFVLNSNPCSPFWRRHRFFVFLPQNRPFPMLRASEILQNPTPTPIDSLPYSASSLPSSSPRESMPKVDKSGRFCSPRAARELALLTIYAACLEGSDPVRLFEKRLNIRREPGYEFDNALLTKYNHTSFGGPPVKADTVEEADELMGNDDRESAIEAEVLSAPPKLVYSKLILRFTRKLLVAVVDRWNSHVLDIDKVAPSNWKGLPIVAIPKLHGRNRSNSVLYRKNDLNYVNEPAGRILEFCILHLAMSEITVLGTRHQIVINEAVDIAKRFCDGAAPRIINGCLRTFVKGLEENGIIQGLESKKTLRAINL